MSTTDEHTNTIVHQQHNLKVLMIGRGKGPPDDEDAIRLDESGPQNWEPKQHEDTQWCSGDAVALQADTVGQGRPFACPYFKQNPKRYSKCRTCLGPGWPSISRLKEHLNRVHQSPAYYCSRKGTIFKMEGIGRHKHANPQCAADNHAAIPGLSKGQQKDLRLRKLPYRGASDSEKWYHIWCIIFPNESPPNCIYYDYQECANLPTILWDQSSSKGKEVSIDAGPENRAGEAQDAAPEQTPEPVFGDQPLAENMFPELQNMLPEPCPPVSQSLSPEMMVEPSSGSMDSICIRQCPYPMSLSPAYLPGGVSPNSPPLLAMLPTPPSYPIILLPQTRSDSCGVYDLYSLAGARGWPLASPWDVWTTPHIQSRAGQAPDAINEEIKSILNQYSHDSRSCGMGAEAEIWEQLFAACNNM
ncbi:hypothetical protein GQ53DRAFT_828387 [Thozetella sp. PMI_491]|nr:hypothetical protein GQ53DRAFT_828387 [Thozetella sp. PMI_491]